MKKRLLVLPLLLLLFSCGSASDSLHGKWVVDKKKFIETVMPKQEQGQNDDRSFSEQLGELLGRALVKSLVDFVADSVVVEFDVKKKEIRGEFAKGVQTQKYAVVSESGKEIKIEVDGEFTVITITGPDTLTLGPGEGTPVPLKRVK